MTQAPAKPVKDSRISLTTKIFYGFGSIAYGIKDGGFRSLLLIYYNQVIGLPVAKVALAIMVALVIDAFLDPLIGEISDNWRSRWGRRHPFMYAAALPAALSFVMLWFPPTHWSQEGIIAYLVVMAIIVRSFITVYEIPSAALVSELTSDYDQRTSLMSFRYWFFFVGGTLLMLLTFRVFLAKTPEFPVGQLNPAGYHKYALVAGAVMVTAIIVSALGTHRHIPSFHTPPIRPKRSPFKVLADMAKTLSHKSFLMVTGAGVFKAAVLGISNSLQIYMNTYFWQLESKQLAILTIDTIFAASIAFTISPWLSKKFGKKNVALFCYIAAYIIAAIPTVIRLTGVGLQPGSPYIVWVLFFNSIAYGAMGISATILANSMIADVVEDNQRKQGRRSEGLFFSAGSLISKALSGVGVFGSGMILAFVQFPENAKPGMVSDEIVRNMALTYLPVAGLLYLTGFILLWNYKIDRRTHEANLAIVNERAVKEELTDPA